MDIEFEDVCVVCVCCVRVRVRVRVRVFCVCVCVGGGGGGGTSRRVVHTVMTSLRRYFISFTGRWKQELFTMIMTGLCHVFLRGPGPLEFM